MPQTAKNFVTATFADIYGNLHNHGTFGTVQPYSTQAQQDEQLESVYPNTSKHLPTAHPGMDITGGGGQPGHPPPRPPLITKKVTIFGHKKRDPQPAVLGSPRPVHVHGEGGGGGVDDATWDTQHI